MNITYIFLLGVFVAILSVLPPGLLNMSAAKISISESRSRGVIFSIGGSLVVIIQTFIAAIFARYLSNHPEIIDILRIVALIVFFLITIYFIFIAKEGKKKKKEAKLKGKKSSFFYGMLISALNVFPVPYQAYMTTTLSSYGLMDFKQESIYSYMIGVGVGSFIALYVYILFFDKFKDKTLTSPKNMNYIIGAITGIIAIITLVNVFK